MSNIDHGQMDFIDPLLSEVLDDIEETTGLTFTLTSLYRHGGTGVHSVIPVRGADLRCRIRSVGRALETYINARWTYDPERPSKVVCIYHDVGQGPHLHVQVHPNTMKSGGYL